MNKFISFLTFLGLGITLVLVGLKFLGYLNLDWYHALAPLACIIVLNIVNFVLSLVLSGNFLIGILILAVVGGIVYFFVQQGSQTVNFNPGADKIEQQFYK